MNRIFWCFLAAYTSGTLNATVPLPYNFIIAMIIGAIFAFISNSDFIRK